MNLKKRLWLYVVLLVLVVLFLQVLRNIKQESLRSQDFEQIKNSGVLKMATVLTPESFYVDGDSTIGFQYELAKAIGKRSGLEIKLIPITNLEISFKKLQEREFDVLARNVAITSSIDSQYLHTIPLIFDHFVLVQRKARSSNDSLFINSQIELAHKRIHIVSGSPAELRLKHIMNEIGDTFQIISEQKYGEEQLIMRVAREDIDYVVCESSRAIQEVKNYPDLDVSMDIGFTQFHSWLLNKNTPILRDSLNIWLYELQEDKTIERLYKKYYRGKD